jgi:hypothetical protein
MVDFFWRFYNSRKNDLFPLMYITPWYRMNMVIGWLNSGTVVSNPNHSINAQALILLIIIFTLIWGLHHGPAPHTHATWPDKPVKWQNSTNQEKTYGQAFLTCNCVVCIATGYRMDDKGIEVRVPVGPRIFSSPHSPDWLWGSSILLYNGYLRLFPRG